MRLLTSAAFAIAMGCASSPSPVPVPAARSAPPSVPTAVGPRGGKIALTGWSSSHVGSLVFVADGHRLVAVADGAIGELDPRARTQVGAAIGLSSGTVLDPNGRPGVGETLSWSVVDAVWAWDPHARSLVGAVYLSAWGNATRGLAAWAPAGGPPRALESADARPCGPLAISPDRELVVARVATGAKPSCDIRATAIQLFSLSTAKPVTPPIEVGFAQVAAFSADGRYVAAGSEVVHVYDIRAQQDATVRPSHPITSLAFRPGSALLAWATSERELETWSPGEAAPQRRGSGTIIAFSPDGHYAATVAGEVALLDGATLAPVEPRLGLRGPWPSADAITFSADSRQLAVALSGADLAVWQLEPVDAEPAGDDGWLVRLVPLPIPPSNPPPPIGHDGQLGGRILVGGKPAANVDLTLTPHPQEYADARALAPITIHAGRDGRFHLANIPAIEWNATVQAPGAVPGGYVFDMRGKRVHQLEVSLDPAVTIRGTVLGPDRRPAKGVEVFHPPDPGYGVPTVVVAADGSGRFVIDHVRPSTGIDGLGGTYYLTARRADGAVHGTRVKIGKAGPVAVSLTLVSADAANVLHVRVVDAAGAPVAGSIVVVEDQWARTDATGETSLDIDTSRVGTHVRVQTAEGPWSEPVEVDLPHAGPVTLRITR